MRAIRVGMALLLLAPTISSGQSADDERALAQLVQRWAAARNANDADAMRPLFDQRVDQVRLNDGEVIASDQDGVVRWFDAGFKRERQALTAVVDSTRARLLSSDTGLVDYSFKLRGADGKATTNGHVTFVCVKRGADWKVIALRFASSTPEARADAPRGEP
jgi:uncharacterized protein (TIGR02246 family)